MDVAFSTRYRREIRVFISSTFRDMQSERDHLINRVFPAVSREAAKRNVTIVPVDLRWGITEEEASQGSVVNICLEQIDRSRPFFIGLIGHRYGWCPTHDDVSSAVDRCPRLSMYVDHGMSMTEIEMQYGVLESESDTDALFLVKEDTPADTPDPGIVRLRDKLRTQRSADTVTYSGIEHLGECVRQRLMAMLDKYYPASEQTPEANASDMLWGWAANEAATYVDQDGILSASLPDVGKGRLYIASPGQGKSAFAAARAVAMRQRSDVVIAYFSSDTGLIAGTKERFLSAIKYQLAIGAGMSEDPVIRQMAFGDSIEYLMGRLNAAGLRVLVIIDGVDKMKYMSISEWRRELLVPLLGNGCSVEVTMSDVEITLAGIEENPVLKEFFRHPFQGIDNEEVMLVPLGVESRSEYIKSYLWQYGKRLPDNIAGDLASKPMTMRELRFVLDETVVYGVFEALPDYICRLIGMRTPTDRYRHVLHRITGMIPFDEIKPFLAVLEVVQHGVPEYELWHDILHWTALRWIEVQGMMHNLLVYIDKGICAVDDDLKTVLVEILTREDRDVACVAIAEALDGKREYDSERVWQLYVTKQYAAACKLLADDGATLTMIADGYGLQAYLYWKNMLLLNPVKYSFTPLADAIETVDEAVTLLEFNYLFFRNDQFVRRVFDRFYQDLIKDDRLDRWRHLLKLYNEKDRLVWLRMEATGRSILAKNLLAEHFIAKGDRTEAMRWMDKAVSDWGYISMSDRYRKLHLLSGVDMFLIRAYILMLEDDMESAYAELDKADYLAPRMCGTPLAHAHAVTVRNIINFIMAYRQNQESPDLDAAYLAWSEMSKLSGYVRSAIGEKNLHTFEIERIVHLMALVASDDMTALADMWRETLSYVAPLTNWHERMLTDGSLPRWLTAIPGISESTLARKLAAFYHEAWVPGWHIQTGASVLWNRRLARTLNVDPASTPLGAAILERQRCAIDEFEAGDRSPRIGVTVLWPELIQSYSDDLFNEHIIKAGLIDCDSQMGQLWSQMVGLMAEYMDELPPEELWLWFEAVGANGLLEGMYGCIAELYMHLKLGYPLWMDTARLNESDTWRQFITDGCPESLKNGLEAIAGCLDVLAGWLNRMEECRQADSAET